MTTIEIICALERLDLSARDEALVYKYRLMLEDPGTDALSRWQAKNVYELAKSYGVETSEPADGGPSNAPNAIAGYDAGERVTSPPTKSVWQKRAQVEAKNGVT